MKKSSAKKPSSLMKDIKLTKKASEAKAEEEKDSVKTKPAKKKTTTKAKASPKTAPKKASTSKKPVAKKAVTKPEVAKKEAAEVTPQVKVVADAPIVKTGVEVLPLKEFKDARIALRPTKRKKVRKTKVFLEGKITIQNMNEFQQEIEPIFENFDFVDFYLKDVIELDLSCMQMLSYFKNVYAPKLEKTVTIDSELPANIKKVIVKAGFEDLMFIPKLV